MKEEKSKEKAKKPAVKVKDLKPTANPVGGRGGLVEGHGNSAASHKTADGFHPKPGPNR